MSPNPPSTLPDASGGTYIRCCSSVPKPTIGDVPRVVCAETVIEWLASTLASSSTMIVYER